MLQGPTFRAPLTVSIGGTIEVETGTNGGTVEVSEVGSTATTSHSVGPTGKSSIPVPNLPQGGYLVVRMGKPPNTRLILVEVIAPF